MNQTLLQRLANREYSEQLYQHNLSIRRVMAILTYSSLPTKKEEAILMDIFGSAWEKWSLANHVQYIHGLVTSVQPWGGPRNVEILTEIRSQLKALQNILHQRGV